MAASENQCERMQDLLSLFVDGRLTPADVARVEAHVARCAGCASYLGFLRATSFVIANRLPEVRPPADLYARIAQMTYARQAPPTWGQRLSQLLAPAPTRWALGTALAAAGIIGVAVLPQRGGNQGISGHSAIPLAAASPKPTEPAASRVALAHPMTKTTVSIAPPAVAALPRQVAAIDANKPVVAPHPLKTVLSPAKEGTAIATLPAPTKHTPMPSIPVARPATHLPSNAPRLATANPAPTALSMPVAHDAISESVRKTLRAQQQRNLRDIATRSMELNQRKAAADVHEGITAPITPREIPVEVPNVVTPSAPVAIPIAAPIQVASVSLLPHRPSLRGYDDGHDGHDLKKLLAGIKTNQHASVNNQYALNEHPLILPVVQDKPMDEK